jgi:hypothetical protein
LLAPSRFVDTTTTTSEGPCTFTLAALNPFPFVHSQEVEASRLQLIQRINDNATDIDNVKATIHSTEVGFLSLHTYLLSVAMQ